MSASTEEKEGYFLHKAKGLYTYQDMKALLEYLDPVQEKNPNARVLLDYSEVTSYEEKTLKMAYARIEKGFPKGAKTAIVYQRKGFLKYILNVVTKAMIKNAKFFNDPQEAKRWLLDQAS